MNKLKNLLIVGSLAVAGAASAAMDSIDFSVTTTNTGANSRSYVIRGTVESIRVTVPSTCTGAVVVTSGEYTVLTKSGLTASATYTPRVLTDSTAGASSTNGIYGQMALAGSVTTTVTGAS